MAANGTAIGSTAGGAGAGGASGMSTALPSASSGITPMGSSGTVAATTPSSGFGGLGSFMNMDKEQSGEMLRKKIADMTDQGGEQAKQQGQMGISQAVQAGLQSANASSGVQPITRSAPIGLSNSYDPDLLKRLMRIQ
jgi:hypothetical protein